MTYNVCIITIIHLSKTSNFSIGALGSALDRVSQSVLKVTKDKESGASILESNYLRSSDDFKPVHINYNKDINAYEVTEGFGTNPKKPKFDMSNFNNDQIKNLINTLFLDDTALTYSDLVDKCKAVFGCGDTAARRAVIPFLVGNRFIKNKESKYYKI